MCILFFFIFNLQNKIVSCFCCNCLCTVCWQDRLLSLRFFVSLYICLFFSVRVFCFSLHVQLYMCVQCERTVVCWCRAYWTDSPFSCHGSIHLDNRLLSRITVMWVLGIFLLFFLCFVCAFYFSLFVNLQNKIVSCFCCNCLCTVCWQDRLLSPLFFMSPLYICLFFSVRGFVLAFTCSCTCVCSAKGLLSADAELINRLCVQCLASTHLEKTAVTSHRPFR